MKVLEVKEQDDHFLFQIEVDSDNFSKVYESHFKALFKSLSVPGFRKGFAPFSVCLQYIKNRGYLEREYEKIASKLIDDAVIQLGQGDLNEKIFGYALERKVLEFEVEKKILRFGAKFEKTPVVEVGSYELIPTLIESKEFSNLCPIPVDRVSKKDDVVAISMIGRNSKEEPLFKYTYDLLEVDLEGTKLRKELVDVLIGVKSNDKTFCEIKEGEETIKIEIWVVEIREKKKIDLDLLKDLKIPESTSIDDFIETIKKQYVMHNSFVKYQDIVKWLFSDCHKIIPLPLESLKIESGRIYQSLVSKGHKIASLENIFKDCYKNFRVTLVLNKIASLENIVYSDDDKADFMRSIDEEPWLYGYKSSEEIFKSSEEALKDYVIQFKTLRFLMSKWCFSN